VGLLEVCACLLDHFELLGKRPLSHIGVRHVEQEETSILQAMTQPLKQHMAALCSSAFKGGCREEVTSLEGRFSQQGSLMFTKGF